MMKKLKVMSVVGMQMLANGSDEGNLPGLSWVPGRVRAFANRPESATLPMPHMGWNELQPRAHSRLFSKGFDNSPQFYFLHSFFFDAEDKNDVAATASYGLDFDAVVSRGVVRVVVAGFRNLDFALLHKLAVVQITQVGRNTVVATQVFCCGHLFAAIRASLQAFTDKRPDRVLRRRNYISTTDFSSRDIMSDHHHLNADGHRRLAARLADTLTLISRARSPAWPRCQKSSRPWR